MSGEKVLTDLTPGITVATLKHEPIILEWIGPENSLFEVEPEHYFPGPSGWGFNAYKL